MYTAEVKIEMFKKYMSTSLFVGLFAVSGVLAVDGYLAVADMHAATDVHAHALVYVVVGPTVVGRIVAGVPASSCCSLTPLLLLVFPSPMPEKSLEPWSQTQSRSCDQTCQAISQGPKKSRFPGPNPLPLALEMDLPASKHYVHGRIYNRSINSYYRFPVLF